MPGGEESGEFFEGGGGLAFFEELGGGGVLGGEPLDEGVEFAEHGQGELFLVGGGDGEVAAGDGGGAGERKCGSINGLAIEFDFDDDLAWGELGGDEGEGVVQGGIGGERGGEGLGVEEDGHG